MTTTEIHARRWKVLGVLSLSLIVIGLDTTILNIALPTLQDEFRASGATLQWMVDSYLLVFSGLLLVFGTLADRFGRKLALQAGVSTFGLASLFAVFAQSAGGVIAVRAAMGVGAGLIMPATLSIIANVFSGEERGKAIGIWAALAALGIGLGPLAGGLLLHWFAWWSVFFLNVPVAAAALLLGTRLIPESRDPHPGSFDLPGAALSTAGFSLLVYAIIEAPTEGWLSGLVLGSFAAAVVLLAGFLWRERHAREPMVDLAFFRNGRFSVGTAAVSAAFFALMGGIFTLTQYLQFAHGYSAIQAGALMTPMALGLTVGAGSSSKAVERLGSAPVVATGLVGLAVMLGLTLLWSPDTSAVVLVGWFFFLTLAMGWVMAPATAAVVGAVPAVRAGIASATNTVARMVSGALGVAVIGSLVSSAYGNDVQDSLPPLPPHARSAAHDSVGAASTIAAHLPGQVGAGLQAAAGDAFTRAMGIGLAVGAVVAAFAAVAVHRFLPRGKASVEKATRVRTPSQSVGYVVSAAIIGFALFASATPSPLYETYSRLWGFSPVVLTLVYATYAIGVLAALLLAGRASDEAGRRPVLLVALGALMAASVLYMLAESVAWLFLARAVQGLATGLALGTASAGLLDFDRRRDPEGVGLTNGVVSAAGIGLGGLVSAALVQLLPAPRVLPYVLVLVLFTVAFVGVLLMPEPVADRSPLRLTPQRPRVPGPARRPFLVAGLAVTSAYSIGGLFLALGPELAARVFETSNHLVTGISIFVLAGFGSLAQLAYGRRAAWVGVTGGSLALAAGVGLIVLSASEDASAPLLVGSAVAGAGFGLAFLGALRALSAAIPPDQRAGVMSAFFVVAYAALSVPAVMAGLAVSPLGLEPTFEIFGAAVGTLALVVAVEAWRTRPRPAACAGQLATEAP